MSLHYLLDGYNIIHQVQALEQGSLEDRRNALVRWVASHQPQGSARNHVTVVFDGSPDHYGGSSQGSVGVVFSQGQSADDHIKGMIERCKDPKGFVVVSDDKEIKLYTRALGAKVLSVKEFMGGLNAKKTGSTKAGISISGTVKKLSMTQTDKINKEFERLWLK